MSEPIIELGDNTEVDEDGDDSVLRNTLHGIALTLTDGIAEVTGEPLRVAEAPTADDHALRQGDVTESNTPEGVVDDPDRYQAAELSDGDSHEVPIQVPDGATLAVYRWGAYDADDGTAPTGLDVELLDGGDTVQASANTTNTQDVDTPVASYENTSGSESVFVLRAKNDTGAPIGDGENERGVGMHFGYVIEQ